jgi:hypothetical protein
MAWGGLHRPHCPTHDNAWVNFETLGKSIFDRRKTDKADPEPRPTLITPPPPLPSKEKSPSIDWLMGFKAGVDAAAQISGKKNANQH